MPAYSLSDPRHPVSRARLMHSALQRCQEDGNLRPGQVIPRPTWMRMVRITTGVMTDKAADDYTVLMEDLGMLRRHHRTGVEVLPPENVLLA